MQGNGEDEHVCFFLAPAAGQRTAGIRAAASALRFLLRLVDMGRQRIQQQQKSHSHQKSHRCRNPCNPALLPGHFDGGNQKGPDRRRDHHPGRKPQQRFMKTLVHFPPQKKYHSRPQRGAGKGNQRSKQYITIHIRLFPHSYQISRHLMICTNGGFATCPFLPRLPSIPLFRESPAGTFRIKIH